MAVLKCRKRLRMPQDQNKQVPDLSEIEKAIELGLTKHQAANGVKESDVKKSK